VLETEEEKSPRTGKKSKPGPKKKTKAEFLEKIEENFDQQR